MDSLQSNNQDIVQSIDGVARMFSRPFLESWSNPTLLNGWVNLGAGYTPVGYYKNPDGIVTLRGLIMNGTIASTTVLFTLPAAYCPPYHYIFSTRKSGGGVGCEIRVLSTGQVQLGDTGGSAAWTCLDGISFRTSS